MRNLGYFLKARYWELGIRCWGLGLAHSNHPQSKIQNPDHLISDNKYIDSRISKKNL